MTLKLLFLDAVQKHQNRIALAHPDGSLTYAQLNDLAIQKKNELGLSNKPFHVVIDNHSIENYIEIWSCLIHEVPFLPISSKTPSDRAKKIISTATQAFEAGLLASKLAYIIFTSGTTGDPKGVPISQTQLLKYAENLKLILNPIPSDRVLQLGDLSFDISIMSMMIAWPHGGQLTALSQSHLVMAPRYAEELEVTIWLSVPSVANMASMQGLLPPNSLPKLRLGLFGGEALSYETAKTFSKAAPNARLCNFWGPTECSISLSHFEIDRQLLEFDVPPSPDFSIIPIGLPHRGAQLKLLDNDTGNFAEHIGELCASGDQLTDGYLGRPDLTEPSFFIKNGKRWYKTGDLAKWDERYGFEYLGRTDRQIKYKGYRIELQDCEAALRVASQCAQVSVIPWPRSDSGEILGLTGFIVDEPANMENISNKLMETLPTYMVPQRIIALKNLPLNISGKTDIKELEIIASQVVG